MSKVTVRLPESLHKQLKQLSEVEGISVNQFFVIAAAEKMSALLTKKYLEQEAAKGKRKDFERVLNAVPHVEPEKYDRL
jgi:3-methyladenine DNA glycosylase AlkD